MRPDPTETIQNVVGGDGVRLAVWRTGAGLPVVLLHGFPEDHRAWKHQVIPLAAADFAVHAADLRGYGASDKPANVEAYRLKKLVADVVALAHAAGPPIHLIGHDWGGVIAWIVASTHPGLLRRLVILNAPHPQLYLQAMWRSLQLFKSWYAVLFQLPWLPERALEAMDFQLLRKTYRLGVVQPHAFTDEEIDEYISSFRQPGALTAALNYYRANLRFAATLSRSRVETETLIIWGERDPALSVKLLDGLNEVAPTAKVYRVPQAGHFVQHEDSDAVNSALLDFLASEAK